MPCLRPSNVLSRATSTCQFQSTFAEGLMVDENPAQHITKITTTTFATLGRSFEGNSHRQTNQKKLRPANELNNPAEKRRDFSLCWVSLCELSGTQAGRKPQSPVEMNLHGQAPESRLEGGEQLLSFCQRRCGRSIKCRMQTLPSPLVV